MWKYAKKLWFNCNNSICKAASSSWQIKPLTKLLELEQKAKPINNERRTNERIYFRMVENMRKSYDSLKYYSIGKQEKNKLLSNWAFGHKLLNKFDKWFGNFVLRTLLLFSMPNAEVDEAEIAKLVSDGGLKETQRLKCERRSYVYLKLSVLWKYVL